MRTLVGIFPFVVAACAFGDPRESSIALSGGTASVDLSHATGTLAQTSAREWSLAKIGAVTTANQTVTWTITATQTMTTANQLVVAGCVSATNSGASGATLGNVVVNLQTRVNHSL